MRSVYRETDACREVALPNFSLKLARPDFGRHPTPPSSSASVAYVTAVADRASLSSGMRGNRRAAMASARGTGRAA